MKKISLILVSLVLLISSIMTMGISCEDISDIDKFLQSPGDTTAEYVAEEVDESALIIWERNGAPRPFFKLYDRFQEDLGWNLKVERISVPFEDNIVLKWSEGKRPDIIDFHLTSILNPGDNWFSKLDPENNMINLSDMEFISNIKHESIEPVAAIGGKVYGVSIINPIMLGIVYNKEIFSEHSLEIPENYEEFYNLCEKIKNIGIQPLYVPWMDPSNLSYYSILWTDGYKTDPDWWNNINSGATDFEQPAIVDGLETLSKMIDADHFQPFLTEGTRKKSHKGLMDGQVAMLFQEDRFLWDLVRIYGLEEVNKKIGMFGLSMDSNTVSWQLSSPGAGYAIPITGNDKKQEGAREFIDYITGTGYQEFIDDLQIPPAFDGFEIPEMEIDAYREILGYFDKENYPVFSYYLEANWGPLGIFMQELFTEASSTELITKKMSNNFKSDARKRGIFE